MAEIRRRDGYCSTDLLVREKAEEIGVSQKVIKASLEEFLEHAFSLGVGKERTSEIFLSRWEAYRMPKYQHSFISHLHIIND